MKKKAALRVVPLVGETYLATIRNCAGSKTYRNFFATVDGKRRDILKNGKLSCAFFASFILHHFRLLNEPHTTVEGTVKDMQASGWQRTRTIRAGNVLVWEPEDDEEGERHAHIGFDLGHGKAISNSSKRRVPAIHHRTFGGTRKVVGMYRHPLLKT